VGSSSQNRTLNLYLQDSEGNNHSAPYQQALSTLGVAGPITTTGSSIGNVATGPLAMSHSILSKDESLEQYGPPLK
jgi:hypothetical protein